MLSDGYDYRVAGLNLLAAIIIYWNTLKLGEAVFAKRKASLAIPAEFLARRHRKSSTQCFFLASAGSRRYRRKHARRRTASHPRTAVGDPVSNSKRTRSRS